jgi:hypothetical protein
MEQTLTIGMAHYDDYHGAYFTIQDIRKELIFHGRFDLLKKINFVVVENNPTSVHAKKLKELKGHINNLKIVDFTERQSTSASRNKIIEEATGTFVLVMDCHVMLCPTAYTLEKLFTFMQYHPKTNDLFAGPLVHDNMSGFSTHFNDSWGSGMWGQWGSAWRCICEDAHFSTKNENGIVTFVSLESQEKIDKCVSCGREFPKNLSYNGHEKALLGAGYTRAGYQDFEAPLEIFSQGLGLFFTRKNSWLKFNEHCDGFGGEECYIHEKYRKNGRKCYLLPFLRWLHRFGRPDGVPYTLTLENKVRNYILEFLELGLDLAPVKKHFIEESKFDALRFDRILEECKTIYNPDPELQQQQLLKDIQALQQKLLQLTDKNTYTTT